MKIEKELNYEQVLELGKIVKLAEKAKEDAEFLKTQYKLADKEKIIFLGEMIGCIEYIELDASGNMVWVNKQNFFPEPYFTKVTLTPNGIFEFYKKIYVEKDENSIWINDRYFSDLVNP